MTTTTTDPIAAAAQSALDARALEQERLDVSAVISAHDFAGRARRVAFRRHDPPAEGG
jgi:hypothetical protein